MKKMIAALLLITTFTAGVQSAFAARQVDHGFSADSSSVGHGAVSNNTTSDDHFVALDGLGGTDVAVMSSTEAKQVHAAGFWGSAWKYIKKGAKWVYHNETVRTVVTQTVTDYFRKKF